jgi:hypothetical protein
MSRKERIELDVTFGGQKLKATRVEYSTGGFDPTIVVGWKSERFETHEFQGDISGNINGRDIPHDDEDSMILVSIHQGLEGLHHALQFLDDRPVDPMGGPERYE